MAKPLTYAAAGVDIDREDAAVDALAGALAFARTGVGAPLGAIGHFAGLVDFGEHALCLCTDGVGSKVEIARAMRKWDTVGIDCMAMNVNDAICVGAEPIAFVDYLAVEDPDPEFTRQIGVGLEEGARQANVSLVGGETASLPGIVKGFDLAGTCLAYAKKSELVTGERIQPGDVLIGMASSGIHSNGYTLARKAVQAAGLRYTDPWPDAPAAPDARGDSGRAADGPSGPGDESAGDPGEAPPAARPAVGDVLLTPTRIYVRPVMALLRSGVPVHGLSHITGSGLRKLRRINQSVRYDVTDPLPVPPVFRAIQAWGAVEDHEMYRTFNMGMGFVAVVPPEAVDEALRVLRQEVDYDVRVVGVVAQGEGVHHPVGGTH